MNEWNEKRLEDELEALVQELPESEDLEKKILQSINRRIRKVVLRTLAGVFLAALLAVLVINPLLNGLFFNPYQMNQEPEQKLFGILRDYFETTHPYREVFSVQVDKKGFARYELELQVGNLTEPVNIGAVNVWMEMNFGRYENIQDPGFAISHHLGRFTYDYEGQSDMMEKISELPESARIYLSVSDTKERTIEELRSLPVALDWFQVYQPNVRFQGGLSARPVAACEEDDLRDEMTGEELLLVYMSNLENLLDNKAAWSALELSDGTNAIYSEGVLQETYEDAKNLTELLCKNYCVSGKRDEVLEFLQENTLDAIYVENVRLW